MNNDEHWGLYNFEMHARDCKACRHPLRVQRNGKHLCETGHTHAVDVANQLYNSRSGTTFSTTTEADGNAVRVEIPESFFEARDLLRAIERSIRHKEPFVSRGRVNRVEERLPSIKRAATQYHQREGKMERAHSVKKSKESHSSEKKHHQQQPQPQQQQQQRASPTSRRQPEVVDWPQERLQRRATVTSSATGRSDAHHRYPVVINDSRTGVIAERQVGEKTSTRSAAASTATATEGRGEIIIEKATALSANTKRGSLYLSDLAELEQRERRESAVAYNLEVREPSSPQRERRKTYRINEDRYRR